MDCLTEQYYITYIIYLCEAEIFFQDNVNYHVYIFEKDYEQFE